MLNWGLCRGHVVIPKAVGIEHQAENMQIFDFKLTEEEIEEVNKLDTRRRLCNHFQVWGRFDLFA